MDWQRWAYLNWVRRTYGYAMPTSMLLELHDMRLALMAW